MKILANDGIDAKGQAALEAMGCTVLTEKVSQDTLASFIQNEKNKNKKYPAAIFIITDGMGDKVNPEFPQRWHWFLSANYKNFIPNKSFAYNLEDFE